MIRNTALVDLNLFMSSQAIEQKVFVYAEAKYIEELIKIAITLPPTDTRT
jgi:hypothetical protein